MQSNVIDFEHLSKNIPVIGENLRLMLWAGDCISAGVTDVERLLGYDVYLCSGYPQGLYTNIARMGYSKIMCILNIHNPYHLDKFIEMFAGKFSLIDSDYKGNTPTLPLTVYSKLLTVGGRAYNTKGINSCRLPTEEYLNAIEMLAPVLPPEIIVGRMWPTEIIELAKDNKLKPYELWTSPDIHGTEYNYIRDARVKFNETQKLRNPAWPMMADDLPRQLESLSLRVITSSLDIYWAPTHMKDGLNDAITTHLQEISDFLAKKIALDDADYLEQISKCSTLEKVVAFQQATLVHLNTPHPDDLKLMVSSYLDERYAVPKTEYGLWFMKLAAV